MYAILLIDGTECSYITLYMWVANSGFVVGNTWLQIDCCWPFDCRPAALITEVKQ